MSQETTVYWKVVAEDGGLKRGSPSAEQVADLDNGPASSLSTFVTGFPGPSGTLLFVGELDPLNWELWKTDGTAAGTVLVMDTYAGPGSGGGAPRSTRRGPGGRRRADRR